MVTVLISRVHAKNSQNRVQNPVKTQSSGQLGKRIDMLRNCNHHFHRRLSSNSGHSFATGCLFFVVWFDWGFVNPFSKLIPSLCDKSVVTLDCYSNFQFTKSSTGPIKVILMPVSGFHKAEGTAKFQKNISKYRDLLKRTRQTTQAVCVDHDPLGRTSTCNTLNSIHHLVSSG